jgi:hypothetical protein
VVLVWQCFFLLCFSHLFFSLFFCVRFSSSHQICSSFG